MIHFQTFLQSLHDPLFWNGNTIFCFQGQEFSSLFFSQLFQKITSLRILPAPLQHLALHSTSKAVVQATLEQSFLGSCTFYWLGNLESAEKWYKELVPYVQNYQGSNIIAFFIPSDQKFNATHSTKLIRIESVINYEQFIQLQQIFAAPLPEKKALLIRKIFKNHPTVSLDTACMLINYIELVSIKMIPHSEPYLLSLVSTPPSLTQLSEYFFAKDPKKFFAVWSVVNNDYPEIFWITFWGDHLWRAFHVLEYLEKKDFINAKKMSFRLPYSFLKKDWQLHTQQQLIRQFENLYTLDYKLKKGSAFPALDLFYAHHFG